MQKRITKIEIENYRAFYGPYSIALEKGENLLVYGENGSGKSSFYRALQRFLLSSADKQDLEPDANIWQNAGIPPQIFVSFDTFDVNFLRLPNPTERLEINAPSFPDYIKKANLSKGFIGYRELLKTHLIDDSASFSFFELFIDVILADFVNPGTNTRLADEWRDIGAAALKFATTKNPSDDPTHRFAAFNNFLSDSLRLLATELDDLVPYFGQGLSVDLGHTTASFSVSSSKAAITKIPTIEIQVRLFGQIIPSHHSFLNEARLSALALSLYLASLKINPTRGECKILFLDDAFIGLDTGNRLPLLQILSEKFSDFQIFLTTYDRAWFDLAKDHLHGNWKTVEMYAQEDVIIEHPDGSKNAVSIQIERDGTKKIIPSIEPPPGSRELKFEKPLIIDPSADNLNKAKMYFDNKDYPAAGNALRKACEKILKSYLPECYLMSKSGEPLELGNLLLNLTGYFEDAGQEIPRALLKEIIFFKNALFNPSSHYDLRSNIYRYEVERALETVEQLRKLPNISWTLVLNPHQELIYEDTASKFKVVLLISDYVYKTIFNGIHKVSKIKFYPDRWEKDGIDYYNKKSGIRYTNQEIAKITTQPQDEAKIIEWIKRFTGKNIDYMKEFKSQSDTLENLLK